MPASAEDRRWLAAAAALAARGVPLARPNPAVGALILREGRVIARGWTQPGGRPHAEAMALAAAGEAARGATLYVTLEPCAHESPRGAACADLVAAAGLARVVIGCLDPDPRTAGRGLARTGGEHVPSPEAEAGLAPYLTLRRLGRPHVTLKLAMSLDGCLALPNGESQWITGEAARAHVHAHRARAEAILVGGGTLRADAPRLDVRLPGLAARSPDRWVLTRGTAPDGWQVLPTPQSLGEVMAGVQSLYVEGGAGAAAAFLSAGVVDRLHLYRAPILIGGRPALGALGLATLAEAHGRWRLSERRQLGSDTFESYEAIPCSLA